VPEPEVVQKRPFIATYIIAADNWERAAKHIADAGGYTPWKQLYYIASMERQ